MCLKQLITADIGTVFLNTSEFANLYNIDGAEITCVIDEDKSTTFNIDGVHVVRRRLFVSLADLGYRPQPEQKINLDGKNFYVVDCLGDDLLEIILEAHAS